MSPRVDRIREAIESRYTCKATHVGAERVTQLRDGEEAWYGSVEIFDLTGHPGAQRCYGWLQMAGTLPTYVTMLQLPPVRCAKTAVRAAMVNGRQKKRARPANGARLSKD